MEIDIAQLLAQRERHRANDGKTLTEWINQRIDNTRTELDRLYRFQALLLEIGEDPIKRLSVFINGEDPDAPEPPQLVVGPHGEGCQCPSDDNVDVDDDDDPTPRRSH